MLTCSNMKLSDYMEMLKLDFYSRVPFGTISSVQLDPTLIAHLPAELELHGLLLDKKGKPSVHSSMHRISEMVFAFKTPGGCWNTTITANYYTLSSQKETLVANLMKNLRVDLIKPEKTEENNTTSSVEIPKMETVAKKKLRKRLKPSFTHKANVGVFNLAKNHEETLDEDDLAE